MRLDAGMLFADEHEANRRETRRQRLRIDGLAARRIDDAVQHHRDVAVAAGRIAQ